MNLLSFLKSRSTPLIAFILCFTLYNWFAYNLVREQFSLLLTLYSILCLSFVFLLKYATLSFKQLSYMAFVFRALFILAIPNLSQDFYRFIWDGRLIWEGLNPYLFTPNQLLDLGNLPIAEIDTLYQGMGALSAMHYSNYPPLNQLCFLLAAVWSSKSILGSVIVLRLLIIAADFGVLYYGKKLLTTLNMNPKLIFWYILNPFIIIELTGNLHFEGVMIFFLISSLYALVKQKLLLSAFLLGCSISIKLIPLLLLPVFFWWFIKNKQQSTLKNFVQLCNFYTLVLGVVLLSFLPFLSQELITNYATTIGLWFGNFEFNASFYYVFREIGYWFRGYNEIQIIGKITPLVVIMVTLLISFLRKNTEPKTLIHSFLFVLSFYLFTSTTIHPWYIATLLMLSVFTNYSYIVVWSFTVFLSYYTYSQPNFKESYVVLCLQYVPVYLLFIWEVILKRPIPFTTLKVRT